MKKVSTVVNQAMFDSDDGYYRTKFPIGKRADFITAPEISQVFGELIAAYFLQISSNTKSKIAFVEMGAGNGTMFFDALSSIAKLAENNNALALDFLRRATFHIVEISSKLQEKQRQKLKDFSITWHDDFNNFIESVASKNQEIFFVCNELFDCFPIDQFVKTDIGWCERMIDESVDKAKFVMADFSGKTHRFVEETVGFKKSELAPFGAIFEYSAAARNFMSQLCDKLAKYGGIAIIIDYGYSKTEFANSLQAVKNHQKVDVLENLGSADITALVDFKSLEKIATSFDLNSSFVTQREFFLGLGIEQRRAALLQQKSDAMRVEINSAIDRLIAPEQMGELFKVLMVWR